MKQVRWGILGGGGIAREFLLGAAGSTSGTVVAIGTRRLAELSVAADFGGLKIHDGYESLLADPHIDAIYIATPHAFHAEWAIKAAQAGKHVLCEKPAAMNPSETTAMFAAASSSGTFMAEAFMYRLHPTIETILGLVRAGKLGEVRMIKSSFGFAVPAYLPKHRLFDPEQGGGAILDVGCYPMSMARLIAGYDAGPGIAEPVEIAAILRNGPTRVDEIASALVSFPNGIVADISCSIALWQDNVLQILGTKGRLELADFWYGAGKYGGSTTIRFVGVDGSIENIVSEEPKNVYSFQFEAVNLAIGRGKTELSYPGMTRDDSVGNAIALQRWSDASLRASPPVPVYR